MNGVPVSGLLTPRVIHTRTQADHQRDRYPYGPDLIDQIGTGVLFVTFVANAV